MQATLETSQVQRSTAQTPDGLSIAVQRHRSPSPGFGDLVFIHGYSQSHRCWLLQHEDGALAAFGQVTYDLRGHGGSDKPDDVDAYRNGVLWADELDEVLSATAARRPILVAWSYGGRVLLDYLARYGDEALAGIVMVDATSTDGADAIGELAPRMRAMHDDRPEQNLAATRALWEGCTAAPLEPRLLAEMIAGNMLTPPYVRRHLSGRPARYEEVCAGIVVPTLVIHGGLDRINTIAMARYTAAHVPRSDLIVYEASAHAPFLEEPGRFGRDLADFARRTWNAPAGI